jgi:hypothetical protein
MSSIKLQLGLTNCMFCEWPGRTEWRASFCPASSTCHSGVVSTCWWTHLKRQKDCKQAAWNWALSIQRRCVQQYWCLSMFKKVCLLGSMKPNCQKQMRKGLCSEIFPSTWLMVKAVLSLGMKKESVAVNCRQKYSKWNGISHLILGRTLRQPLQQGKAWPFWGGGEAECVIFVIMRRGQTTNSYLYKQNLAEKF